MFLHYHPTPIQIRPLQFRSGIEPDRPGDAGKTRWSARFWQNHGDFAGGLRDLEWKIFMSSAPREHSRMSASGRRGPGYLPKMKNHNIVGECYVNKLVWRRPHHEKHKWKLQSQLFTTEELAGVICKDDSLMGSNLREHGRGRAPALTHWRRGSRCVGRSTDCHVKHVGVKSGT